MNIIDQCVGQGVPFAREYGALIIDRLELKFHVHFMPRSNWSAVAFGAYSAMMKQVHGVELN